MEPIRFDGQVVVVTGAGRGLGRAHARQLADLGAAVVVNDAGRARDGAPEGSAADEVVAEILAAGGRAVASAHDVTDSTQVDAMIALAQDQLGGFDAVISNAGFLRDGTLAKLSDEDIRSVVDVHLVGGLLVARAAMQAFRDQGHGRIVLTTSAAGFYGNVGQANYAAAKLGLVGAVKVLALEGRKRGVLVNAVAPAARTRMLDGVPLGRLGDHIAPEQASPLFAYLCSRACTTSGEVFECGGGAHRRVVIGATDGWFAGVDAVPSVDDVAAHWDEIGADDRLTFPTDAIAANGSFFAPLLAATRREASA